MKEIFSFWLKLEMFLSVATKNDLQYFPKLHTLSSLGLAQFEHPKIVELVIQDLLNNFYFAFWKKFKSLNLKNQQFINMVFKLFQFSDDLIRKVYIIQENSMTALCNLH